MARMDWEGANRRERGVVRDPKKRVKPGKATAVPVGRYSRFLSEWCVEVFEAFHPRVGMELDVVARSGVRRRVVLVERAGFRDRGRCSIWFYKTK